MERLLKRIVKHEGYRQFPYFDCCGKFFRECTCEKQGYLTISIGRCIELVGISKGESIELAMNDIRNATASAYRLVHDFGRLDDVRREVIVEMIFQLGARKFMGFRKMLKALSKRDFEEATLQMLDSLWAKQTPKRAEYLALAMKTGKFPEGE